MVNVIIDASTMGRLAADKIYGESLAKKIIKNRGNFSICNFKVVRDELRKAPKQILEIYDNIASKKMVHDSSTISNLAKEYFNQYRKNGGGVGRKKILKDFKIVACASIRNCDLIFSDDDRTLKSSKAVGAYKTINLIKGYRTPTFYGYNDLRRRFLMD
ncbi:hypothetical protein HY448_02135 [Candidatus Pacearchaeota archaeon]|nr:hypothetical protein [Candidatus Pacearchaeota archaeon]